MTSLADGEPRRRSWFDAWVASAYGPEGFWPRHRPEEHFRTAAASTPLLAEMAAAVVDRTPGVQVVLDLGAGSGQLLTALHELRPGLQLVAVDLRDRPAELPAAVEWARDLWDVRYDRWTTGAALPWLVRPEPVMIICCEWLDDLPVVVVRRHADGWREMIIGDDGTEEFGPRLHEEQLTWADQWWPAGQRAEVGLTRDRAWTALAAVVARRGGCALMIDYGHRLGERPADGSFAAYRDGRAVLPDSVRRAQPHGACQCRLRTRRRGGGRAAYRLLLPAERSGRRSAGGRAGRRPAGRSRPPEPAVGPELALRLGLTLVAAADCRRPAEVSNVYVRICHSAHEVSWVQ